MRSQPFFLPGPSGRLFAIHHRPDAGQPERGQVLCVLPFNEESNRCRSMVTLQARAFADQGLGTLVLDPYGCGDSEGQFGDLRWAGWAADLRAGFDFLEQQPGGCRWVWGIRLGVILGAELLASLQRPEIGLLAWQAVADGKTHLTQFLRVKMAANLDRPDQPKETPATMRAQFAAGESVEVGGYELHPELATAMDAARLDACKLPAGTRVLWLEQAGEDPAAASPATQMLLGRWPGEAVKTELALFEGPAFWAVHERCVAPAAIERTRAYLHA